MNILLLDSSTNYCSVSLKSNDNFFSETKYLPRKHNEYILYMIDSVISKAKITKTNIHLLGYGTGPGSFTGVRLSATLMHGMSFILRKPVLGFSSMSRIENKRRVF